MFNYADRAGKLVKRRLKEESIDSVFPGYPVKSGGEFDFPIYLPTIDEDTNFWKIMDDSNPIVFINVYGFVFFQDGSHQNYVSVPYSYWTIYAPRKSKFWRIENFVSGKWTGYPGENEDTEESLFKPGAVDMGGKILTPNYVK